MADQTENRRFDILAVGDASIDNFIKLKDESATIEPGEDGKQWLRMPYAAKLPFQESTIVHGSGNAANASVNFTLFGLKAGLVANVGNDEGGRAVVAALESHGVNTSLVRMQAGKKTNYHYVLWYKDDRTILTKHEDYEYHWPHLRGNETPKWLYLTSMGESALDVHDDIIEWLDRNPDVKMAFQPGTLQIKLGKDRLRHVYEHAHVIVLNREEAAKVTGGDHGNVHELLDKLHEIGAKYALVTDGSKGSYASDGQQRLFMPIYPDVAEPVERTGCGDAFASTFVACLMRGYSLEGALQLAPIPPASVVLYPGSRKGLLSGRELKEWLERAPADYRAERME